MLFKMNGQNFSTDKDNHKTSLDMMRYLLWNTTPNQLYNNAEYYNFLYDLCIRDCEIRIADKVQILTEWIFELRKDGVEIALPHAMFLKVIASVFWKLNVECKNINLEIIFETCWHVLKKSELLKNSCNLLLRSLCYINLNFFDEILSRAGINVLSKNNSTKTLKDFEHIIVHLPTVAIASQSPLTVQKLIDSGLPKFLTQALHEYTKNTLTGENVPEVLDFLAECCSEKSMRDYLGLKEMFSFWKPLLESMCLTKRPSTQTEREIQRSTIKFFSRVVVCHEQNRYTLISLILTILSQIQRAKNFLSPFLQQLINELILKAEYITILVNGEKLFKNTQSKISNVKKNGRNDRDTINLNPNELENFDSRQLLLKVPLKAKIQNILLDCLNSFEAITIEKNEKSKMIMWEMLKTLDANKKVMGLNSTLFHYQMPKFVHPHCPEILLTEETTVSQILTALNTNGHALSEPIITLEILPQSIENTNVDESKIIKAADMKKFPSILQSFIKRGGLTLLESSIPKKLSHEDSRAANSVPNYALSAFRQFLRLPFYADYLLQNESKARCLLKSLLGETDDGDGNNTKFASSLRMYPFIFFHQLLINKTLDDVDCMTLRSISIEIGAMQSVLNALEKCYNQKENKRTFLTYRNDQQPYFPNGIGFNTGSLRNELKKIQIKNEDELITILLLILSNFINPGDKIPSHLFTDDIISYHEISDNLAAFPPIFVMHLEESGLIRIIHSYLQNDSILDISREVPLYRAVLQLLRAMAVSKCRFENFLTKKMEHDSLSIDELLIKMKDCVDIYTESLKKGSKSLGRGVVHWDFDDVDGDNLALFIPDLNDTVLLLRKTLKIKTSNNVVNVLNSNEQKSSNSMEEKYLDTMRKHQFTTYDIIADSDMDGSSHLHFSVSYHFQREARSAIGNSRPLQMKRLAQDASVLSKSLPLSYNSSIFVCCDTNRLDLMKVLIIGPIDTPYANGCFEFDVFFPSEYPIKPMQINFETTGRRSVRFNPNLYKNGKVCLSILNTWPGSSDEMWNAQTSSFLQVLVSIQSLILVSEPYFNEPAWAVKRGTPNGTEASNAYNVYIYSSCIKWAMLEQIRNPNPCFKEVIHKHFWLKRHEICEQIESYARDFASKNGNCIDLWYNYCKLREELGKLATPPGLEDLNVPFDPNVSIPCPISAYTKERDERLKQLADSVEMP